MAGVAGKRVVSPTLVGRVEELELLLGAIPSPPAVVVIEGEAGIGKTRLVTEFADRVGTRDLRFLVGSCLRIREPFPLGPVIEAIRGRGGDLAEVGLSPVAGALRPLLPELAQVLPPPPPPLDDRAAERHRVFRALAEVLTVLGPAVLVLENLHWADEQTVDFLSYLLGDPPPKLVLVLTFRSEEVGPDVRALTAKLPPLVSQAQLVLSPLDVADTGALAAAILELDRVSAEFAGQLWRRTAGLPLALEELLALLRMRGDLVRKAGGGWVGRTLDGLDVPTSIRDQVWQRVSRLSEQTRSVVEAAAVLQVAVPISTLIATCRVPERPARAGMEEALEAGVLVETPAGIGFRHPLAAQAVYEGISGPRRQDLHLRATTALGALPEPPRGLVAHHLRHAGRLAAWVTAAEQAADQALELGHDDEAARLLEDVLRNAPLGTEQRAGIAVKLGRAAVRALHPSRDVADLLETVLRQELPRPVRGELRLRLAMLLERLGADFRLQRPLLAAAAEDLDELPEMKAQAMLGLGLPFAPGISLAEHRRWLRRVRQILPDLRDPAFRVLLVGKVAQVLVVIGDPEWWRLTERMLDETGGAPRERQELNAYCSVAIAACYAGHLAAAERLLTAARDGVPLDEGGHVGVRIRSAQALLGYCRGDWDGLAEQVAALIDELDGDAPGRGDAEAVAGCLAFARGELDRAAGWFEQAMQQLQQRGAYDLLPIPATAMIRMAVGRGDADGALAAARRLLAAMESVPFEVSAARALPAMTEALVAAGEAAAAGALVERYAGELSVLDAPLAEPALRHARGGLAAGAGQWRLAAEHFQAAADSYERLRCPYESAQVREQAALALLATGAEVGGPLGGAAGALLRAALATYQRLGATWDYSRAAAAARRYGISVPARHRGGHRGYQTDLSPREREVAELAATGRTNKEISSELYVSANTVKKQLASAMRKLGVRSRAELAYRFATGGAAGNGPAGP